MTIKYDFFITDVSKLKNYGFVKDGSYYEYTTLNSAWRTLLLEVEEKDGHLRILSNSTLTIKVIIDLAKDGLIIYKEKESIPKYDMKLTKKEMDLITEMRKKNEGQEN